MTAQTGTNMPSVDLVIFIDTSRSMGDEARALSEAAEAAIEAARNSCPCDLRVVWLGVNGVWRGTRFDRSVRDYLTGVCNVDAAQLTGRTRGMSSKEDGARSMEDLAKHFDWRPNASQALFYLSDEALEGGGERQTQEDYDAANKAIATTKSLGVKVHTYFGTSRARGEHLETIKGEFARVAAETGGQFFSDRDAIGGFTDLLRQIICGSRPSPLPQPEPAPQPAPPVAQPQAPSPAPQPPQPQQPIPVPAPPKQPVVVGNWINNLTFDTFDRNPQNDIVCVAPVRTIVRREEEILLVRRVRKVEEIDASPACPINTTQVSQVQQES